MSKDTPLLVLDLSRVLAGPLCGMYLGDLGADVIKVESPNGDDTRNWGPPFFAANATKKQSSVHTRGEAAYYLSVNRNKKSISVDLKQKRGQQIVQSLAKKADVIIENFRVGGLKKYSLDYNNVKLENPNVVYCSISGYGQNGPFAQRSGYDFIIQGESGFMSVTGDVDGESMKTGVAISDIFAGYNACIAILIALLRRSQTGKGDYIDISLLDCSLAALVNVASNLLVSGKPASRFGNHHPNIVPYGTFKAKDRTFNLAIGNDRQFANFARLLNKNEWLATNKYVTNQMRVEKRTDLIAEINDCLCEHNAKYWLEKCHKLQIPAGLVCQIHETLEFEQIKMRNLIQQFPNHLYGNLSMIASPMKFLNHSTSNNIPPPLLGQHSSEILENYLNMSKQDISKLINDSVVFVTKNT